MTHQKTRVHFTMASVLMLLLIAATAVPAGAADLVRRGGAEELSARLVNCMRVGGYVTKAGKCQGRYSGRFSKPVPRLLVSKKVSNKVSLPWAQKSVGFYGTRTCWIGHAKGGSTVDGRFSAAYLKHVANGENMGCGYFGNPRDTVVRVLRVWQAEKSYNGSHWRQLKDPAFKSVGVGVASFGPRKTQIIVNFYGKRVS